VSISTSLKAYYTLEDRGLIEARPQSGYYVRIQPRQLPSEPKRSAPRASAQKVEISDFITGIYESINDPNIIPFGVAAPSEALLPIGKLNRLIASISRRETANLHKYEFAAGNEELRRQIARRAIDSGGTTSPEEIVITYGCLEALNLCLRAVANPGDTIAVESPTYFGVLQIIECLNMKVLEIPTDPREGVCLDLLESSLKKNNVKACLFMPTFHNPLGTCMTEANKKRLVEMLARMEIPLIEDDMYGDLHYGPQRPRTCKSFDKEGLVLTCSSFSKTISPGFRIGWTAPGRFADKVVRLKITSTFSTHVLPQLTIAEFLHDGGYDRHMRKIRRAYAEQMQRATHAVARYFPEGTKMTRPEGGFVLWVELPSGVDALELFGKAMEKGISVAPGPIFSAKGDYRNFIRLNCSNPWSERLEDALNTLGRIAGKG
jgi:DNA-binding transcriptional MocR family regulator